MTDLDLDQIEARAAQLDTDEYNQGVPKNAPWRAHASRSGRDRWIIYQPTGSDQSRVITEGLGQPFADFIAHSREDVPALVAEVRRLRGELERHKAPTGDAEIDALLAKCKRNAGSKGYRVAAYALRSLAAARAEAERLRERTHEIADEANRRYAPYVSRCAEFDNQIAAAREHFSRYAFPEPFSGVPRTWWDMTGQYNRLALMEIIGQRDAAVAEAARVREALQAVRDLHVAGRCGCDPNSPHSTGHCRVCGIKAGWPCATVRALDAALDGAE